MWETGWLRCKVHRGMFSNEYAVVVETGGQLFNFFAPTDFVQIDRPPQGLEAIDGRVRVHVIDGPNGLVYLPGEPFEGSPLIRVSSSALAAA
jgi:hypothetical protein